MQLKQRLTGVKVRTIAHMPIHLEGTAHLAGHLLDPRLSAEHAVLAGNDHAAGPGGRRNQRRADVAVTDVLGQRVSHTGLNACAKRL